MDVDWNLLISSRVTLAVSSRVLTESRTVPTTVGARATGAGAAKARPAKARTLENFILTADKIWEFEERLLVRRLKVDEEEMLFEC